MAKYKVPYGMLKVAGYALGRTHADFMVESHPERSIEEENDAYWERMASVALEAAIRWQAENPPVPTSEQLWDLCSVLGPKMADIVWSERDRAVIVEWIRRMYLAPEVGPAAKLAIDVLCGVTLSPADADAIMEQVACVAHGWVRK